MKKKLAILFIGSFCAYHAFAQDLLSHEKLTLEKCLTIAGKNSLNIKRAQVQKLTSEIECRQAKNRFLPQVSANIGQGFDFGRSKDNTGVYVNRSSANTGFSIGGSIDLFRGFIRLHGLKFSKIASEIASLNEEQVTNDLNLLISGYFYTVAYKQEVVKVLQLQKEQTEKKVSETEIKVKGGKWDESRLYDMQAELAQNELNITEAKAELSQAILNLYQAMNVKNHPEQIEIDTPEDDFLFPPKSSDSVDQIYQRACNHLPQIKATHLSIEQSKEQIAIAKGGYLPSLSLSIGYNNGYFYNFQKAYRQFNKSFSEQWKSNGREGITLSVNIPIFDAFTTKEQIAKAKAEQIMSQINLNEKEQEVRKTIEQAFNNAQNAREQLKVAQLSLEAAEKAQKIAEYRFEAGKITTFEYNESTNRVSIAKIKLLQAKYDYIQKKYILDFYKKI